MKSIFLVFGCLMFSNLLFAKTPIRNLSKPHVLNELIVKYSDRSSLEDANKYIEGLGGTILHRFRSKGAFLTRFKDVTGDQELLTLAAKVSKNSAIEYVEANHFIYVDQFPNDPKFPELYGLSNTGQQGGTVGADIDAIKAWEVSRGSRDVLVAVIDTGVDYSHNDLENNYWSNPGEVGRDSAGRDKKSNGIDDDGNGYIDDWRGWNFVSNTNDPMDDHSVRHGTHCAGTIGAEGNNNLGVTGVNWHVSIVGLKFIGAGGFGTVADAVKAIEYATLIGVDITSNSWGGGDFSQTMYDAIEASAKKGILFVAAAGNMSSDTDEYSHYPSSYDLDNIVAVAAVDRNDQLASFSNFGLQSVDIAAPGVDILSCSSNNEYALLSGTSMATPHVAGAAALIKSVYPEFNYQNILDRLYSGVDFQAQLKLKVGTSGRLNIANSIEHDEIPPSAVSEVSLTKKDYMSVEMTWLPAGDDDHLGLASHYSLRYSEDPILTEQDWLSAREGAFSFIGSKESPKGRLSSLRFNYNGYLSIRARDNVGNLGPLGEPLPFETKRVNVLYQNLADSMSGTRATGSWDVENLGDSFGNVFSDSPKSNYSDNTESHLQIGPISVILGNEIGVSFFTKTALEKGYDFGFVEISFDQGSTWTQADLVTGFKAWHHRIKYLTALSDQVLVRFRLKTDKDLNEDGWFLDDVMIISKNQGPQ